ncbi:hypothetical protein DFP72DRAFT_1040583 [Ephemerocybe angulata]|uniref:Uncharacterized protein n=1 Tax=Ephemerocybe angulata TaxID=980116 RepID=A0A8H6IGE7_9AGAR|nr:hypothetical protein DFP72DRAFT_1040583 [Tulosesus angulatus]
MSKAVGKRAVAQKKADTITVKGSRDVVYAEARKQGDALAKQGVVFLEEAKGRLQALKEQEVAFDRHLAAYEPILEAQENAFEALIALYPGMIEDLGKRRAEILDAASRRHQAGRPRRVASTTQASLQARKRVEETVRKANDAADAEVLIKNFKRLARF